MTSYIHVPAMLRDPRLHGLTSDHHQALVLVRTIRKALAAQTELQSHCATVGEAFDDKLNPHFIIEEELLLPHLGAGSRALLDRTLSDHQMLRQVVAQVREGAVDSLDAFADLLEAHVRFEERELFPACESELSAQALEAVAGRAPHPR